MGTRIAAVIAVILVALAIIPKTAWLVPSQVLSTIGVNPPTRSRVALPPGVPVDMQRTAAVVAVTPLHDQTALFDVLPLEQFVALHPGDAVARAYVLRFMECNFSIRHRPEIALFERSKTNTASAPGTPEPPTSRAELERYDAHAAAGERLDPNNAYFPVMRAIGLYAVGRDTDAEAALDSASKKPDWNDYVGTEADDRIRLVDATQPASGLAHVTTTATILMPYYAGLRCATRIAVAHAMKAEQAGDIAGGLRLRNTVGRLSSLIRTHSPTAIGTIVGAAMSAVAIERPGGAPLPETGHRASGALAKERIDTFSAYARRHGEVGQIGPLVAEAQAGAATKAMTPTILNATDEFQLLYREEGLIYLSFAVLLNAFWLLIASAGGMWIARMRHSGLALAIFLPLCLLSASLLGPLQFVRALGDVLAPFQPEANSDDQVIPSANWEPLLALVVVLIVMTIVALACRRPLGTTVSTWLGRYGTSVGLTILVGYIALALATSAVDAAVDHDIRTFGLGHFHVQVAKAHQTIPPAPAWPATN